MADIVDINISQTVETVDIIATPNLVTVNINQVTGGGGGDTNLGYTPSATNGIVTSDTGTDAIIPLADATNAGLLTPAEKTKLDGIAEGAEVNVNADWNATSGDAQILNKPTIPSTSNFVPYTGATTNVDLGTHSITVKDLIVNHSSGSGDAATITKGGSGEALKVVKTSGSGNAASITGGVTLLDELHLNTDLADTYIASASIWNAKQTEAQVQAIADAKVTQTITNGVTTTAPSEDAVFDALALKQNVITLTTTGTNGASTLIGATLNIPQYSGATNLGYTPSPTNGTVTSSTGSSATLPLADATNAGLLKPDKFTVLENTSGTNTGDQDLSSLAPKESPTFTGTVVLPNTTSIGNVSSIEIGYLDNVTSSIQTQLDSKISKDNGVNYNTNFIKTVTAAEYSAIGIKDSTTLYFII